MKDQGGEEEAASIRIKEDESNKNHSFEWTNSFPVCENKARQAIRLSFLVEENEFKINIPVLVKTYPPGEVKRLRNGKALSFINYKIEPNLQMGYDIKAVEFSGI